MVVIDPVALLARQAEGGPLPQPSMDLSTYPTSELQQAGFFLLFFFPALAFVVVCMRVYSRIKMRGFGWDDGLIIAAMILSLLSAGFSYIMMKLLYIGVYASQVPTEKVDPRPANIWRYIVVMLYNPQLALVKSSMLLFLLRLGGQKKPVRIAIHVLNGFNVALMVAIFFSAVFTCVPVSYFWDKSIEGRCNQTNVQYILPAYITVVTDLLVLILPSVILSQLQMRRRAKICLIAILSGGFAVMILGILRIVWFTEAFFRDPPKDRYHDIRFVSSSVETNVAIICASLPAMYSELRVWFPGFMGRLTGTTTADPTHRYGGGGTTGGATGMRSLNRKKLVGTSQASSSGRTAPQRKVGLGLATTTTTTSSSSMEGIVTSEGIVKTTEVAVVFGDAESTRSGRATSSAELASRNRYEQSIAYTRDCC